jgi:hypothetical protein
VYILGPSGNWIAVLKSGEVAAFDIWEDRGGKEG